MMGDFPGKSYTVVRKNKNSSSIGAPKSPNKSRTKVGFKRRCILIAWARAGVCRTRRWRRFRVPWAVCMSRACQITRSRCLMSPSRRRCGATACSQRLIFTPGVLIYNSFTLASFLIAALFFIFMHLACTCPVVTQSMP